MCWQVWLLLRLLLRFALCPHRAFPLCMSISGVPSSSKALGLIGLEPGIPKVLYPLWVRASTYGFGGGGGGDGAGWGDTMQSITPTLGQS